MKDVFMLIGRDCTDEVHFNLIEDESVFEYIIMNPDDDVVQERLWTAQELGHVVMRNFTQTRCEENFLKDYNIKRLYCYLVG